jgi:hypothetical protein
VADGEKGKVCPCFIKASKYANISCSFLFSIDVFIFLNNSYGFFITSSAWSAVVLPC